MNRLGRIALDAGHVGDEENSRKREKTNQGVDNFASKALSAADYFHHPSF
ncbi:MAG TPA: hypothetical protein VJT81_15145 [Burkholderiales bacterium]|nr:hypothetical protein [Burkholderiales bacterium]